MTSQATEQPLFQSRSSDGKMVMLSVLADGGWTIRSDGELVPDGSGAAISIDSAVRKFRAMVRPAGQDERA
jgi:hypothetical protein